MDLLLYRAGGTLYPIPLQLGSSKTCIQKNVTCEFLVFSKCTHTESNCDKISLSILNFTLMSLYEMTYGLLFCEGAILERGWEVMKL